MYNNYGQSPEIGMYPQCSLPSMRCVYSARSGPESCVIDGVISLCPRVEWSEETTPPRDRKKGLRDPAWLLALQCRRSLVSYWSVMSRSAEWSAHWGCWNAVGQLDGRIKAWVPLGQLTQEVDGSLDTYLKIL